VHLDETLYQKLRNNQLTPDERQQLSQHLLTDCEQCETFLESQPQDALDLLTDVALADNARSYKPLFRSRAKVMEATSPSLRIKRSPRWSMLWGAFAAGATVAAAGAAVFVMTRPAPPPYSGMKGLASVELGGMVSTPAANGARALTPLLPGAKYSSSSELYLTWELAAPAFVYVGRVSGDEVEPFYPPSGAEKEDSGMHAMTVGGVVHSYSLDGLRGKQRFVLIASDTALGPDEVKAALKKERLDRGSVAGFGVSVEDQK